MHIRKKSIPENIVCGLFCPLCVVYMVELWTESGGGGGENPKIVVQIADPSRIAKAHIVSIC